MIRTLLTLLPAKRRPVVIAHAALTVLSVILRGAGTVLLVPLIAVLFNPDPGAAWLWLALLAGVTAAGWAVDALIARIGFDLGFALLDNAQHGIADRLARIRLGWFTAGNTATARQAVAATGPELVGLIVYLATPLLTAVLLPVVITLALIPLSWQLGLAALAGVPLLLGAFWISGRLSRRADRLAAEANSALTERIVELARTQQVLRAARRVEPGRSHAGAALERQHSATLRLLLMQIPGQLLFSLASQLALLILAGATVVLAVQGVFGVGEAIALIVVIVRYLEPFTTLGELSGAVESAATTLGRLRAVLDAPAADEGAADATAADSTASTAAADGAAADDAAGSASTVAGEAAPAAAPRIELRDVSFSYAPDAAPVLEGLNLVLEPGSTTAIVGPSGSGKSTVLALLAGLHEPGSGGILLDGVAVEQRSADARREALSVVFQHPYLFTGSIRENILAARPDAAEQQLHAAASLAQLDELIARLPGGWDAPVGEAGAALSGGERQRVSIARALLKPAPILLIDEATSALDTENEAAIVAALAADPVRRTRVVVAHRLSSIRTADRVLFLEDGRIVEDGAVDGLLAAGGRFAEFWTQQEAAARWRIGTG